MSRLEELCQQFSDVLKRDDDEECVKLLSEINSAIDSANGNQKTIAQLYVLLSFKLRQVSLVVYTFNTSGITSSTEALGKRPRRIEVSSKEILMDWLDSHRENPYPSVEEKKILCSQTGLSLNQLNNWFINARRRVIGVKTPSHVEIVRE